VKTIEIASRKIGPGHPCFIIAEIGGNFRTYEEGISLIDEAGRCGADAVKLQTFRADTLAAKSAVFDMENTGRISQYELFKEYELSDELHNRLWAYAADHGILLFSTPSHESDVDFLVEDLDVPVLKIGSDDVCNLPFIEYAARQGRTIILSTGMSTLEEVGEAVATILRAGCDDLILLHCVTNYPAHFENVNLKAMLTLAGEFGLPFGYSDHTLGNEACFAAVALGAQVIEKHFTLNKNAPGPDHMLSADPAEMTALVKGIRNIEKALGDGIKRPADSEQITRYNNRKSIVTVQTIPAGARITREMIAIKRPGYGIQPKYLEMVIGRIVRQTIGAEEVVTWDILA